MGFWAVVIASVVLVFLWGLISPRSQWKVLAAWSYRNPQADEPSSFAYAVQRVISGIGVVFFGAVAAAGIGSYIAALPPPPPELSSLQRMWGVAPVPQVVDRIVIPVDEAPAGLVDVQVEAYQLVNNAEHRPRYLHLLEHFDYGGDPQVSGMIGVQPAKGIPALDSAELVVQVHAWGNCIPREAVIVETEESVSIGVYVGMASRSDGVPVDHMRCDRPPFVQNSLLIPINLSGPLEDRQLLNLDGSPIRLVEDLST